MYHHPSCEECREGRRSIDVNHTSQLESFICSGFRFRFRFRIPVPFPDSGFPGFPYAPGGQTFLRVAVINTQLAFPFTFETDGEESWTVDPTENKLSSLCLFVLSPPKSFALLKWRPRALC